MDKIKRVEKTKNGVRIIMDSGTITLDQDNAACIGYFFGRSIEAVIDENVELFNKYRDRIKPRSHLSVVK